MIYRIRCDLMTEKENVANIGWQKIKDFLNDPNIINLLEEKSFIEYEHCYHDETPTKPCEIIERHEK